MVELKRLQYGIQMIIILIIIILICFAIFSYLSFGYSFNFLKYLISTASSSISEIISVIDNIQIYNSIQTIFFTLALIFTLLVIIYISNIYFKMRRKAFIDPLTGLYNKRALKKILNQEISRAQRFNHPLTIVMMDLDHFKNYNDTNGHVAGDKLLQKFARLIQNQIREIDNVARYGGEEFTIILPETTHNQAVRLAERIRRKIESTKFKGGKTQPLGKVTVSMGLATFKSPHGDQKELIHQADELLYQAKLAGRNILMKKIF